MMFKKSLQIYNKELCMEYILIFFYIYYVKYTCFFILVNSFTH